MSKHIAFLRGINISGKNIIAMKDLKDGFLELGFKDVSTYLNSGNVIFSCENQSRELITKSIEQMIKSKFGLDIPIYLTSQENLERTLKNAPSWWGSEDKNVYDNLIFIIPPLTFKEVYESIGDAKKEIEKIENFEEAIFWSFVLKSYNKTNWIKTASSSINNYVTIRTANTVKKLLEICKREG